MYNIFDNEYYVWMPIDKILFDIWYCPYIELQMGDTNNEKEQKD